ncbi:MAG: amidohydrolase family protein [Rhodospirillales bacterium]
MIAPGAYIDHHCHAIARGDLERPAFEALISESHRPAIPGCSQFDKPLGLLIRKHCAPIIDLEPFCTPEAYMERRLDLGCAEVNRRLLQAADMTWLLIDTGHRSDSLLDLPAMAQLSGARAREVVRVEAVMEEVARYADGPATLLEAFAETLHDRARDAVGLKSIVAYRVTFDIDQTAPSRDAALEAAAAWLKTIERDGWQRLEDAVLIRHALFVALDLCVERGFPLQLHTGVGDSDVIMPRCDPTHFTPFIMAAEAKAVPLTLLHCYPFEREAAWLAEVFSNVYYDVGFTLNFTGALARRPLADALEMGPFFKQLYSTDAFGLAELHYLGRVQFDRFLSEILDGWIAAGDCTASDAERIAAMIAHANAERIYPLSRSP